MLWHRNCKVSNMLQRHRPDFDVPVFVANGNSGPPACGQVAASSLGATAQRVAKEGWCYVSACAARLCFGHRGFPRFEGGSKGVCACGQGSWHSGREEMRDQGRVIARALLASEESRICANYGNSCVAHVWPKQVRSMGWGVPPSREKLLCVSIVMTSVLGTCCTEAGSLRLGCSLVEAVMAQLVFGRLVLAMLPRQSLQRAMSG